MYIDARLRPPYGSFIAGFYAKDKWAQRENFAAEFGMMNMKQFIQFFGGKSLFTILMLGVIQIPWWHLMGLF